MFLNNFLKKKQLILRCFSSESLPVITAPKNLEGNQLEKLYKKNKYLLRERYLGYSFIRGNNKIPIITSKKKSFYNHYYNQRYSKRNNIILASDGWKKNKNNNDCIKFVDYENNNSFLNLFGETKCKELTYFSELDIDLKLCENLKKNLNIEFTNEVQQDTIPKILSGNNVYCSYETGSGKTIAYALPIVHLIMKFKKKLLDQSNINIKKQPYAIVVVPTRELVCQTSQFFQKIAQNTNVGISPMVGGKPLYLKHTGYDIVISTPGLINNHIRDGVYDVKKCRHLVLDEADTLFDNSFQSDLEILLQNFNFNTKQNLSSTQIVLVSATFPKYVKQIIYKRIDGQDLLYAKSAKINKILSHVEHIFYKLNKKQAFAKLVEICLNLTNKEGQVLIFSNDSKTQYFVYKSLNKNGFECVNFSKNLNDENRICNFIDFQKQNFKFMSATDLASRGLDTSNVRTVINFDFPQNVVDYLHRAGRTGRFGLKAKCKVISFVCSKKDVFYLKELELSLRKNEQLSILNDKYKNDFADLDEEKF